MTTAIAKSEVISLLNRLNHQIEQLDRIVEDSTEKIERDRVLELVQEAIQEVIQKGA